MSDKTSSAIVFSHIGNRTNHEDNFLLGDKYLAPVFQSQMSDKQCCCVEDTFSSNVFFCAISDGMGGHNAGEVASRICVE